MEKGKQKMKKEIIKNETYKIEIDTFNNKYVVSELEEGEWSELKSYEDFNDAKKYIEQREKRKSSKKKVEPLNILFKPRYKNKYCSSKITSISGDSVWISSDKDREKVYLICFLKDNEKNVSIIREIEKLEKEIESLEEQKEKFTEDEINKHFGE